MAQSINNTSTNRRKYFMVFICMLIQAIPYAIAQNIQPLFVPYVVDRFHFSLASFSLIFTFGALASAIFSPFLGKLFDKMHIKLIFIAGTVISSVAFIAFGIAKTLPEFYIYASIQQVGCLLFSSLGVPYIINNWFPEKGRGKALGIAFSGGAIGNIFLQQLTSYFLATQGPSVTYVIFGIISLLVSLPIVLLFIRLPKTSEIVDTEEVEVTEQLEISDLDEGLSAEEVRKNKYFWIFSIGYFIIAIAVSALSTQYATYFTSELNFSALLVGTLGSVFAACCLIGNLSGGVLFDKLGTFKTMFIAMVLQVIAILAMLLAKSFTTAAFLFSISYGLNVYSYMSAPAFMASDVFGKKDASVKLGIINLIFWGGYAAGSGLFGIIVDEVSFTAAWITLLGCTIIGYWLLLTGVKRYKNKSLPQNN